MANAWPSDQEIRSNLAELFSQLTKATSAIVSEWQGITYRFASRNYSDRIHFTDGEGARKHGGRFTPIGSQRTLYLSLDRATATAELDSWYEYYGVPDSAFQPRVLAAVAVSVGSLIDLTVSDTVSVLGLSAELLNEEWRLISDNRAVAPIQTFGRLVYEAGFEGIRYTSARRQNGVNLALFPDNFQEQSHALMLNSE